MSDPDIRPSPWRAIAAATALNAPLGSLYAFSVFLKPLETLLGLSRADLALVFALATVGFGVGMNLAPYVYGSRSTPLLVLACAAASSLGIALAATAGGLVQLAFGYGVLFGFGGGAAYILVQQVVNLAVTTRQGLVNGYVVALYPAGAMIAAPVFGWSVGQFGVRATLGGFATVLAVTGLISAWLIAHSGVTLSAGAPTPRRTRTSGAGPCFWRLSLVFFLAASAGLMVLSQAAGIITAYGGTTAARRLRHDVHRRQYRRRARGRRVDGRLAEHSRGGRRRPRHRARRQHGADAGPGPEVSVLALTLVGLGYGVISGVTAAAVAVYWRRALYGRMASRIYLAWCAAAIILPIAAGRCST